MKSLVWIVTTIAAIAGHGAAQNVGLTSMTVPNNPPTITPQTGCPTVTETGVLCASCAVPACLALSTVTQSCGCPTSIPTVVVNFPCEAGCSGIWCSTSYDIVQATGTCDLTTRTSTSGTVSSHGPTVTEPSGTKTTSSRTVTPPASGTTSLPAQVTSNAAGRLRPFWVW